MSLLERPEAKVLLEDAVVSAGTVRGCRRRLTWFRLSVICRCFIVKSSVTTRDWSGAGTLLRRFFSVAGGQ